MNISFINIKNFRKLTDVKIDFSDDTTLLVGANNSSKTSAMDSLLFKKNNIIAVTDQPKFLQTVNEKVNRLADLWDSESVPTCIDVYKKLHEVALFELPKRIDEVLSNETEVNERITALREGLNVPFSELINYWEYINGNTQFSTHQGIKGLEFDRVSVNWFSEDKIITTLNETEVKLCF